MVRIIVWVVLTVLSWWISPYRSHAQGWGPRGCAVVTAPVLMGIYQNQVPTADYPPGYWWKNASNEPDLVHLYMGPHHKGTYSFQDGLYRPLLDYGSGTWGAAQAPPVSPPARPGGSPAPVVGQKLNFGIDESKLGKEDVYYTNQGPICRSKANQMLSDPTHYRDHYAGQHLDDKKKLRLVVIGQEEVRKRILRDFEQTGLDTHVMPWSVPPGHWSLKDNVTGKVMFAYKDDLPTIYLQTPDGKVLHRQADYKGKEDFQAIRKAVDAYDSSKDPDLRIPIKPVPVPVPTPVKPWSPSDVPMPLWIGAGILIFLLLQRRNP